MDVPSYYRVRRRGERTLSPARFCSALGPCADFVPAIADGVLKRSRWGDAFPSRGGRRLPARPSFATTVTLICAQLVAVAVRGLILRISGALAYKRCGVVLPEDGVVGSKVLGGCYAPSTPSRWKWWIEPLEFLPRIRDREAPVMVACSALRWCSQAAISCWSVSASGIRRSRHWC